jgi:hypothetical protein
MSQAPLKTDNYSRRDAYITAAIVAVMCVIIYSPYFSAHLSIFLEPIRLLNIPIAVDALYLDTSSLWRRRHVQEQILSVG